MDEKVQEFARIPCAVHISTFSSARVLWWWILMVIGLWSYINIAHHEQCIPGSISVEWLSRESTSAVRHEWMDGQTQDGYQPLYAAQVALYIYYLMRFLSGLYMAQNIKKNENKEVSRPVYWPWFWHRPWWGQARACAPQLWRLITMGSWFFS